MEFEGQPHCGLDDAKNIARIAIRLLKDKAVIRVNEKLQKVGKGKSFSHKISEREWTTPVVIRGNLRV